MKIAIYGAGQLGNNVARILAQRPDMVVQGPGGRDDRDAILGSGADVVVIATTSFLRDVAPDIRLAVESGSNVIVSAEEAAFPWANDQELADELDTLARGHGVTVLGGGLNPGFAFDALVLTALGPSERVSAIRVERIVDLSGFGETVLRRIGVGFDPAAFGAGTAAGSITGHIGFPQSMRVVAGALGVTIERIDRTISPIFGEQEHRGSAPVVVPGRNRRLRAALHGVCRGVELVRSVVHRPSPPDGDRQRAARRDLDRRSAAAPLHRLPWPQPPERLVRSDRKLDPPSCRRRPRLDHGRRLAARAPALIGVSLIDVSGDRRAASGS